MAASPLVPAFHLILIWVAHAVESPIGPGTKLGEVEFIKREWLACLLPKAIQDLYS